MKKRMLAMVFAVVMVCGMAGCGGSGEAQPENENPIATEMQAELQSYAADLDAAAAIEAGLFTIANGQLQAVSNIGMHLWQKKQNL